MANNVTHNPWILDTAASNLIGATVITKPKKLKWIGEAIADGDELKLTDAGSAVTFRHFATADDTGVQWDYPADWSQLGFVVATISHGELYVWF